MDADDDHHEEMDGIRSDTDSNSGSDTDDNDSGSGSSSNNNELIHSAASDDMDLDLAQDENPLLKAPDRNSPSHILMALNADCLYEIFKRLHFLDLLNVAKVCMAFEIQAKAAFASNYKWLRLYQPDCDQNTMVNILKVFGSCIQELWIKSDKNGGGDELLHAVIQHCSPKLTVLRLYDFKFELDLRLPSLCLPFPELKELGFGQCSGNLNLSRLIDDCPELQNIWFEQSSLQRLNGMISREFQELERFCIMDCDVEIDEDALENFVVWNPTLKDLFIDGVRCSSSHAICLFGQNMLELQKLHLGLSIANLEHFQSDAEYIGRLCSLKELGLNFNGLEVTPLANVLATNNVPIKDLFISHGIVDGIAIKCISQLKLINTLELQDLDGFNEEHLISLARGLRELRNLHLSGLNVGLTLMGLSQTVRYTKKLRHFSLSDRMNTGLTINTEDYKDLVDIVKNRPEKTRLRIEIRSNLIKVNVPDAVLQEHHDILSIE